MYIKALYNPADSRNMMDNVLSTPISDRLLRQIWDFLDAQADCVTGGSDPAQVDEPNAACQLLQALDFETGGYFR
jgi:hypothetical protein